MKWVRRFLCGVTVITGTVASEAAPMPTESVFTNKSRFGIPFRYDSVELERLQARQIQLHVSTDHGRRWQHAESVSPDTGRFDFQSHGDGEYWFQVRTIDVQHRMFPDESLQKAGLKVIVDTQPPTLDLKLRQSVPGKVELTWTAFDRYLDPATLVLEYIQTGSELWKPVGVIPEANGKTSWTVPDGGTVAVRGSIRDRAANVGRLQIQIAIEPAGHLVPKPTIPDFSQPIADGRADATELELFPGPNSSYSNRDLDPSNWPGYSAPEARPHFADASESLQIFQNNREPEEVPLASPAPEIRPRKVDGRIPKITAAPTTLSQLPIRSGRYRVVNSRKFDIHYKIDEVGPSGVGGVELFITQNNGQKWWEYPSDSRHTSPFEIEVPSDGAYGFAIRARSGVGLAADPPLEGESPTMVVLVDQTSPKVRLLPIQQGHGASLNQVLIRWSIADENPAQKPVSLFYSRKPSGPFEPIVGWQEDTGKYQWTVGPGVPSEFYIRLTARDAAGNLRHVTSPDAVVVDLSKPTARIVDVKPNADSSSY